MIYLNLVSPQQQKVLKYKTIFYYIENFLGLLVFVTILLSTILIPINASLGTLIQETDKVEKTNSDSLKTITEKIDIFNQKVINLDKIQSLQYDWVQFFSKIDKAVTSDIYLSELNAKSTDHQFSLKGWTNNRDSFINFKTALINTGIFSNLNTPITDLLKKENIEFNLQGNFQ
jgi:hypothetical protein